MTAHISPFTPPEHCLLAFEALVRQGSVGAAAKELGVTRSALHRSVSLLEHLLRCTVFKSIAPQVVLTEAGSSYFASVRTFVREVQEQLSKVQSGTRVSLRVASCPALARFFLVPALPAFRERLPQVDLELATTSFEDQESWATHYDAVLWYGFRANIPMEPQVLWPGNSVTYAAPRVRLRSDLPAICWSLGEVAAVSAETKAQLLVAVDLTVALEMACAGAGTVACPSEVGARFVGDGSLVPVSAAIPDPRALYLFTCGDQSSALSRELTRWIADAVSA